MLFDRMLVDAAQSAMNESGFVALPILIAISPEPGAAVGTELARNADRYLVSSPGPEFLDHAQLQLAAPFACDKSAYLLSPPKKVGTNSPLTVDRAAADHGVDFARIPGIFRGADSCCQLYFFGLKLRHC